MICAGNYGDSINEMAWAVGRVVDTLRKEGIDKQTLILFQSDHGPHTEMCTAGGQTAAMRGAQ